MSSEEAFRLIDKDGNKKISADELMAILSTDEANAAKTLLQSVIDMVDENGDGVLQLEEFETIWQLFLATRRDSGDIVGPVISATAAVNTLLRVGLEFSDTEKRLTEALGNFKKQAEILQTTYVEEVTRKQTEFCAYWPIPRKRGVVRAPKQRSAAFLGTGGTKWRGGDAEPNRLHLPSRSACRSAPAATQTHAADQGAWSPLRADRRHRSRD